MSANILDGKQCAELIYENLKGILARYPNVHPVLAMIQVGNDPASTVYINNKVKVCRELGIEDYQVRLPEDITEEEVEDELVELSNNDEVDGIMLELPLPEQLDTKKLSYLINAQKDVDGVNPTNVGLLAKGYDVMTPCTAMGVNFLLQAYKIPVEGKRVVIVGRSDIVGKPLAMLLTNQNATVTLCHSHTIDLPKVCKTADILITAIGKPKYITNEFVRRGTIVIDCGMNRDSDGKLCGDVDFDKVKSLASWITPVPNGVGRMTVAALMTNTITSALSKQQFKGKGNAKHEGTTL